MEEVTSRIKAYVLKLYPTILTDLSIDDDYLAEVVADVVDRFLAYTNRDQLVTQYEEDLIDYPNTDETWDDYWEAYDTYPVPARLERILARIVIGSAKTILATNSASAGNITSLEDNGQKVTYGQELAQYFGSAGDSEVFSGNMVIVNQYRIPTVIKDAYDNTYQF